MGISDNFEHKCNKEDHKCSQTTQKVNVSELGLVTPAGKFVWGKVCFRCLLLHVSLDFSFSCFYVVWILENAAEFDMDHTRTFLEDPSKHRLLMIHFSDGECRETQPN